MICPLWSAQGLYYALWSVQLENPRASLFGIAESQTSWSAPSASEWVVILSQPFGAATQGRFLSHLEQWEQLLSLCDRNMYMWRGHANNGQINFPIFTTRNKQSTNFPEFVWIGSWNNLLTQRQPQDCLLTPDWTKLTASTKCTSNAWIFYWMCTHIGETLGNKLVQTHAIIK